MGAVRFGPFSFDTERKTLERQGTAIVLGSRGSALLSALVGAEGEVVARSKLLEVGWPGMVVEEANLTVQIAALRKALGTRSDGQEWIATMPRAGYRLLRESEPKPFSVRPAVAVLPFANMSSDPEQEYFADGVVEDLITALSKFKTFAVVARSSTFAFKRQAFDVREVARQLGVSYLLEGSVRRSGDAMRVSAQLIDGMSGRPLWAEKFDGAVARVFDFQDMVTTSVVGLVEPQIRKAEIERAKAKRPETFDAWDLYLRALPIVYGSNVAAYDRAIELLERAVELDPGYGPALTLAAWAHEKRRTFGGIAPAGVDDVARSMELAERAVDLDSDDAVALAMAGWFPCLFYNDFSRVRLVERAVELNPNSVPVLQFAGTTYLFGGELMDVIKVATRALTLSPGGPENYMSLTHIAQAHVSLGNFEEAIVWAQRANELNPQYLFSHMTLACAFAHLGLLPQAREAAREALAVRPDLTVPALDKPPVRYVERRRVWADGLRKAGLRDAPAETALFGR
jgi:TolB-like protein